MAQESCKGTGEGVDPLACPPRSDPYWIMSQGRVECVAISLRVANRARDKPCNSLTEWADAQRPAIAAL